MTKVLLSSVYQILTVVKIKNNKIEFVSFRRTLWCFVTVAENENAVAARFLKRHTSCNILC